MEYGTFYGVSIGPGDPEDLTLKAAGICRKCSVWAVPRTGNSGTIALDILRRAIPAVDKQILYLDFLMTRDTDALARQHRILAQSVRQYLDEGQDVAMLNLGDVSVYSTFSYLAEIVAGWGYQVVWIPGVTSFCASACRLGRSLTEATLPLHIFPGSYDISKALTAEGSKVLMKSGRQLPQVISAIENAGLAQKAALAANCGMESEKLCRRLEEADGMEGYFTTILIKP